MTITAILYIELFALHVILIELDRCLWMLRLFFVDASGNDEYQKKNSKAMDCRINLEVTFLKVSSVHLPLLVVEYPRVNG